MSLSQTLRERLAPRTDEQRDAEWRVWLQEPQAMWEIIQRPTLGIPPSERSDDERREIILSGSKKSRVEH
jgi:hypothetical protein